MGNPFLASFLYFDQSNHQNSRCRRRPYWKCNLKVNGHRNPCNITFPTKCGIESPFLASFLYFDESKYQNSRWPPSTKSIFFCFEPYNPYYLLKLTRKTRFQQYVFISWYHFLYFDEPKHKNSRWPPVAILKIFLETGKISLFLFIIAHRAHFWHHICILSDLNVKTQDGRHLSSPLFSDLSHSIHCSCWMSHQKLVSSNICWFYVLPLHIFPQWSPRKVEINNFFK